MNITTDRRSLLAAIPAVAVVATVPAAGLGAGNPDAALLAAFDRWQEAHVIYEALPYADEGEAVDFNGYTAAERAQWAIIDEAEEAIRMAAARTPEGAAIQLWVALYHHKSQRPDCNAALQRDLAYFNARDEDQDWNDRLVLAALRSLESMGR